MTPEERAGILWPELVRVAKTHSRSTITYSEVAEIVGYKGARPVHWVLGPIQSYCWDKQIPKLTVVAVKKTTGKLGKGFWGGDPNEVYEYEWASIKNPFDSEGTVTRALEIIKNPNKAEEVLGKVQYREGQEIFRKTLLLAYKEQCAICGFGFVDALEAAHIVPWKACEEKKLRISPKNGILLCANHHKLFDSGRIFVTEDYGIEFVDTKASNHSESEKQEWLNLPRKTLKLPIDKKLWPDSKLLKNYRDKRKPTNRGTKRPTRKLTPAV